MKTLYWYAKINMAGNLEGFAQSPGNLNIDFLETDRTFCSRSRTRMSHKYFDGREMGSSICMLMTSLLVLEEARKREDLHLI
jgi:hypothetical protein